MQRQWLQWGGNIEQRAREQPVERDPRPEYGNAVLVAGACEQCMWTGFLERDVELHDGVSDAGDTRAKQSVEWGDRSFDDGGTGLGGCVWGDFV